MPKIVIWYIYFVERYTRLSVTVVYHVVNLKLFGEPSLHSTVLQMVKCIIIMVTVCYVFYMLNKPVSMYVSIYQTQKKTMYITFKTFQLILQQ